MSGPIEDPLDALAAGEEKAHAFRSGRVIPVPPDGIERELAGLWRSVWDEDGHRTVTRACLWTLLLRVPAEALPRARRLVDDLSESVPARVVVLASRPGAPAPSLRATVEANWRVASGGEAQIGSEEITLEADGSSEEVLPSLLRSLLLADVPTATLWLGAPPRGQSALDRELRDASDRLILDGDGATVAGAGAGLVALARFLAERPVGPSRPACDVADLAWLRGRAARALLASLFDAPAPAGEALTVTRIRISYRPDRAATALLSAGWLASRLRLDEGRAAAGGDVLNFRGAGGQPVQIALRKSPRAADPLGGIELFCRGGRYAVSFLSGAVVLETPAIAWKEPLSAPTDAELWASALGAAGRDPLYVDALQSIAPVARPI